MNIKVPVSWLREYLKTDVAAKTLASRMSLSGPSVERVGKIGDDLVFDIEVTSNRVDAYSIFGIAREAHAILKYNRSKSELVKPKGLNTPLEPDTKDKVKLDVLIKNPTLCNRYTAIVIDDVKVGPSPAFIKNHLTKAGIRPINNIVDISNYIMLELGQPMHTYDFDKIKGNKMIMRESTDGEKVKTLDGKIRKLPKGTIVFEDGVGRLIDLCGIMGGESTGITTRTKRVLLYVQSYDPVRIRKTTQALSFRTEAASIFEKGVDIEAIPEALARSVYLVKKLTKAKIVSELIDITNHKPQRKPIELNLERLNQFMGIPLDTKTAVSILESLGFQTKSSQNSISATPPSWRTADIESDEDLIEEIARIYGYHNLPSIIPTGPIPQSEESILPKIIELKKTLKYLGLTEIISYSIISKSFLTLSQTKEEDSVELANPLTEEWQFMRPTLLVSLADVIAKNQNLKNNRKLFEVAKTYIKKEKNLPRQDLFLSVVLQNNDFESIKGVVESIFDFLQREIKFEKPEEENSLFAKEQSAILKSSGQEVGTLGVLNSNVPDGLNIEGSIAAVEINLTTVYSLPAVANTYRPIPKYPPVIEDISIIVNKQTQYATVVESLKKAGSPLLKNIEMLDMFEGEQIGKDKKSITFRLMYQSQTKTPTQLEVEQARGKIVSTLESTLKAQVRR